MEIVKTTNGNELVIALKGRLDTVTAPELEAVIKNDTADITSIVFDFEALEYISSAGLRVLLAAQKLINSKNGNMKLVKVCEDIKEVFDITGFSDILTVE